MEANAATAETEEEKGGPSFVPAVLVYDDVVVVEHPEKKQNPIEGHTLADAVGFMSPFHCIKKLKKGAPLSSDSCNFLKFINGIAVQDNVADFLCTY